MAVIKSFPKDTTQGGFAYGADQGMKYISGAGKPGTTIQWLLKTASGTSQAIVFADEGLQDMANASYVVIAQAETGGAASNVIVDESSKATTGFTILATAASEVLNILVVGTVAGQSV